MRIEGKHIVVGISGGIAAYKIPELIRQLKQAGAEVKVTTTHHALELVTELTLRTVSGYPVYSDVFAAINAHSTEHISLPDWADMMIIAPATANVLGKMAFGIADDALTTTFAAMRKPVIIAPAMNDKMYAAPATQTALTTLAQQENILVLDAAEGELACGSVGRGRMQEPEEIVRAAEYMLTPKDLTGKRLIITAGPTRERLDPVRYLSNFSTGKMGYALARQAYRRGADVTLISGPCALPAEHGVDTFLPKNTLLFCSVESAEEMYRAATQAWQAADIAILSAAVADFTPEQVADNKIKKVPGQQTMHVTMTLTQDIAATLGATKTAQQQLIGFALETQNEQINAKHKMQSKHMDMVVLNSLRDEGAGFGTDTNRVTLFFADGTEKNYPLLLKEAVADCILDGCLNSR